MKVYISGKISGLPQGRVEKKFKDAENWLRTEGYTPVNPAGLQIPGLEYEDYMTIDLAMLSVCDAIFMLSDWIDSPGAIREHARALELGLKFMYEEHLASEISREEEVTN